MANHEPRRDWSVIGGLVLVVLGVWLLVVRFLGQFIVPMRVVFDALGRVAWPLLLIGLGVLLILGARRGSTAPQVAGGRLYRSRTDRMIAGVLGGVAQYLGWDATLVRVAYVVLAVATGFGAAVLLYVLAIVLIPEEPLGAPANAPSPPPPARAPEPPAPTTPASVPEPSASEPQPSAPLPPSPTPPTQ